MKRPVNRLIYVASGLSYMRITYAEVINDLPLKESVLKMLRGMQRNPVHKFAGLYNAWCESVFGPHLNVIRDGFEFIEADSGGLQIITQGAEINDEAKEKVYANQAAYADYGMCFDEIPLRTLSGSSSRNDTENRLFDESMLEECAKNTAFNIKRQIEVYDELGSRAKPIIIIQGNGYDSYMKWAEVLQREIPEDYYKKIGGLAMSAAAMGNGPLEDIRRAFYYTQMPECLRQSNHLHLLGIGSLLRMAPNLIFISNGAYGDKLQVSYDSTTHVSGITNGRYYFKNTMSKFGRAFDSIVLQKMANDIKKNINLDVSIEELHSAINTPSLEYKEIHGSRTRLIEINIALSLSAITNFISDIEDVLVNKRRLIDTTKRINSEIAYHHLYNVRTLEDFLSWERDVGKYVPSKAVLVNKSNALSSFFI